MVSYFQLPLSFAPDGLQADLDRIKAGDWVAHFNAQYFDGDWSGVALRSCGGQPQLYSNPNDQAPYADTPLLFGSPNLQAALAAFECPLKSVRLLRLGAGSQIREHRDYDLGFEAGEIRIHIPIVTNPEVEFYLDGQRIDMREGETWYLDLSRPHRVQNHGTADRVHLVLDCVVNDWLKSMIPFTSNGSPTRKRGESPRQPLLANASGYLTGSAAFEQFRELVLEEESLQQQLRQTPDRAEFTALVAATGAERGFHFSTGDVDAALNAARRAWVERWI